MGSLCLLPGFSVEQALQCVDSPGAVKVSETQGGISPLEKAPVSLKRISFYPSSFMCLLHLTKRTQCGVDPASAWAVCVIQISLPLLPARILIHRWRPFWHHKYLLSKETPSTSLPHERVGLIGTSSPLYFTAPADQTTVRPSLDPTNSDLIHKRAKNKLGQ